MRMGISQQVAWHGVMGIVQSLTRHGVVRNMRHCELPVDDGGMCSQNSMPDIDRVPRVL